MKKNKRIKDHLTRQRGEDRKRYFSQPGATASDWRGGRKQVTKNKKRETSRKACRRRVK